MRKTLFALAALAALTAALVSAGTAAAGDYVCNNQTLGPMTVKGNLVVPSGAFCDLNGTHVTGNATAKAGPPEPSLPTGLLADAAAIDGNVHVEKNAQFAAFDGSTIGGNVQCEKCEVADVQDSTVSGNLEDDGITEGAFLDNSTFGGNLQIHNSSDGGFGFSIDGNSVGGNLQFMKNTGASDISGNTIAGNLQCKDNAPPPAGADNTAKKKDGQCALL